MSHISVTLLRGIRGNIGPDHEPTGIEKIPLPFPVRVTTEGIADDFHGDLRHHGGPDKALHHYPFEHYGFWKDLCGSLPVLSLPGAFGENISTRGLTESAVCLGDTFRLGTVLLQVSQARQPCWKLNFRLGRPNIAPLMQEHGLTGWYYRVLEGGAVQASDHLALQSRPLPSWPLSRLLRMLHAPCLDPSELREAAGLPFLAESWKRLFTRRLETGEVEDWRKRLFKEGIASGGPGD